MCDWFLFTRLQEHCRMHHYGSTEELKMDMQQFLIKAPIPEILRFTFSVSKPAKCKPQYFRNWGLNQKSLHQIPRSLPKEHTCQVSDHSSKPVLQEVAQKLKKQSRHKAVKSSGFIHNCM